MRKLYVFKHDSRVGNERSNDLFDKITVERKSEVEVARNFKDYTVTVERDMPEGVTLIEKL